MALNATLPILTAEPGLTRYLEEIRRFPMLERQEEYLLAKRWREHGDRDAAHKLVTSHLRLVTKIARDYRGYGLPISEMISEGNVGLMQAVDRFEPEKGFRRVARPPGGRIPGPGNDARRERGVRLPPQDAVQCAHGAQHARAAHLRDAPARRGTDHAGGAGRAIRRLARARAPARGERLREGAERSEAPRRGDGHPGASAGALASNLLPWWEKLTMEVSLWGTSYG